MATLQFNASTLKASYNAGTLKAQIARPDDDYCKDAALAVDVEWTLSFNGVSECDSCGEGCAVWPSDLNAANPTLSYTKTAKGHYHYCTHGGAGGWSFTVSVASDCSQIQVTAYVAGGVDCGGEEGVSMAFAQLITDYPTNDTLTNSFASFRCCGFIEGWFADCSEEGSDLRIGYGGTCTLSYAIV